MKLLLTGASGFLGKNIRPLLAKTYDIATLGLNAEDDYVVNLAKEIPEINGHFDIVLHAAGKVHEVPQNEFERQSFFDVNLQGTKNLCCALVKIGLPKAFIFISTVAVYGCESGDNITEEHPLNGTTPYASSKIQSEEFLQEWCSKHNVTLGIVRPSLLVGPNPPGSLGSMIRGIKSGRYLSICGGTAQKSVLMVHDIARVVPALANKGGIYNMCDDSDPTFVQLEKLIAKQLNKREPLSIPYWVAKCLAVIGDRFGKRAPINSLKLSKITQSLTFSNKKIKEILGWTPTNVLDNFSIE